MKPHAIASLAGVALFGLGALASAKSDLGEKVARGSAAAPSGSSNVRSLQGEMAEEFRRHRPKPHELEAKLGELRATGPARRAAHRAELRLHYAGAVLHNKDLLAELRQHARRVAFMTRAKFIATTELEEPKRTAALARIDKLMSREQARHERKVEKLKLAVPPPGPSGAPSAAATPAPSGSAQ